MELLCTKDLPVFLPPTSPEQTKRQLKRKTTPRHRPLKLHADVKQWAFIGILSHFSQDNEENFVTWSKRYMKVLMTISGFKRCPQKWGPATISTCLRVVPQWKVFAFQWKKFCFEMNKHPLSPQKTIIGSITAFLNFLRASQTSDQKNLWQD